MIQANSNTKKLTQFALKLLAKRDHFISELLAKLKEKGSEKEELDQVIKYIKEFGYVDDRKTLKKYAKELAEKGKGVNYLKKKLYEKGCLNLLSEFNIDEFYTREMEEQSARKLCAKLESKEMDAIEKKLNSRGFSVQTIRTVVKSSVKSCNEYED